MRVVPAVIALAGLALAGGTARAEHEVIYRYTVVGYVKDGNARPVAGTTVQLVRDKTGIRYLTDTDTDGLFIVTVRLGDESVGETLTLTIGAANTTLTAHFDPRNQQEERGTRVDLEGARWRERPAWFRSTLFRLLAPKP